jgi:hypothetical protein
MGLPVKYADIFELQAQQFNDIALKLFRYQSQENEIYHAYIEHIGVNLHAVKQLEDIPFMPIEFFKKHQIICKEFKSQDKHYFESSSTTGIGVSRHYYSDSAWYHQSFRRSFKKFFHQEAQIFALLPGYLERTNSSLVYMVNDLMVKSNGHNHDFYLNDHDMLIQKLSERERLGLKSILFGVTHALLDLAEHYPLKLTHTTIIETGGMKGRGVERTTSEVHDILKSAFEITEISGEYGMTELFSQAYSRARGVYTCPPWMKILIRHPEDPFDWMGDNRTGGICVVDLANVQSCCFLMTSDLGKLHHDNTFEVLGRFDQSDIRGCSLLIQ